MTHLLLVLASANSKLQQVFEKKAATIVKQIVNDLKLDFDCSISLYEGIVQTSDLMLKHFSQYADDSAVVMLVESGLKSEIRCFEEAAFVGTFEKFNYTTNVPVFLSGTLRRLLKNFGWLMAECRKLTRYQALVLPIDNFRAKQMDALVNVCTGKSLDKDFANLLNQALGAMLRLKRPHRRSSYPGMYFVDEHQFLFQYGQERHTAYETGGDHLFVCRLNGCYRFGIALEQQRHFNVSKDEGKFDYSGWCNCHRQRISVKNRDHVNMFTNGYFK